MFKNLLAYRNILFVLIFLNSEALFLTDDKKAGIPFLREAYLLAIVGLAFALCLIWRRVYQSKAALWILFFGIFLPLFSAILAYVNFGQPLPYGLLEERRSLAWLSFFVMLFLLIKTRPDQRQIEGFFLMSAIAASAIGFMYYLSIIPDNAMPSFAKNVRDVGDLRPNRYRIGAGYVTLGVFILLYRLRDQLSLKSLGLVLYFTAYLWLVLQTRSTMLVWAVAAVWIFRKRLDSAAKVGLTAGLLLGMSYLLFPEFYVQQYERLLLLYDEAVNSPGVRDDTIATIMQALRENNYIGKGALSLQWNDGFAALYDPHFYLSDVGIVGVYHRFGFLTPLIALLFYGGFIYFMRQVPMKGPLLSAFQLGFWIGLFNMFLSNAIMFGGDTLGITLACFLYFAKVQLTAAQPDYERVNHDPIHYRHYKLE